MATSHSTWGELPVAICGTVSFTAITCLVAYTGCLAFQGYRLKSEDALARTRFLRTQFGLLYANLVLADYMHCTAFAINYYWFAKDLYPNIQNGAAACQTQAILIQASDIACLAWSFIIAVHTAVYIIWRYEPPIRVIYCAITSAWLLVLLACMVGPLFVAVRRNNGVDAPPFYDNAGLWCWIASGYEPWRLYAHYLWVFISATASLCIYLCIFLFIWLRLFQRGQPSMSAGIFKFRQAVKSLAMPPTPPIGGDSEKPKRPAGSSRGSQSPDEHMRARDRQLDKVAAMMLLFPIGYICCILPLATFRLGRMTGAPWASNLVVQSICGSIFAMNGTCNVVLFLLTRHTFRGQKRQKLSSAQTELDSSVHHIEFGYEVEHASSNGDQYKRDLIQAGILRPMPAVSVTPPTPAKRRKSSAPSYQRDLSPASHRPGLPRRASHESWTSLRRNSSAKDYTPGMRQPSALSATLMVARQMSDGLSFKDSDDDLDHDEGVPPDSPLVQFQSEQLQSSNV